MIEFSEHYYSDDPGEGHPDVRTFLKDVSYFFIGNGFIQAAVQVSPEGEGSPIGLLIMDPEELTQKRRSFTFDKDSGIEDTMIHIDTVDSDSGSAPEEISAEWDYSEDIPSVRVRWSLNRIQVEERFYCPDRSNPSVIRETNIKNQDKETVEFTVNTGMRGEKIEKDAGLPMGEEIEFNLIYKLDTGTNTVSFKITEDEISLTEHKQYWNNASNVSFGQDLIDHYFQSSCGQLASVISKKGKVDASIWQYNREWVRDHSFMVMGLLLSGHHEKANTVLDRLLTDFVSDDGDTIDSSEIRKPDEVELDQNGLLLYTLKKYVLWTDDIEIISKHWNKIFATAEYPLKDVFRHKPSGMFYNRREYWERHKAHGIDEGLELGYQYFNVIGLSAAAFLARKMSKDEDAARWDEYSEVLNDAMMNHPEYKFVDSRGFIKRRSPDGTLQEKINIREEAELPEGLPLTSDYEHYLNPDSSCVYPIVYGSESPDSEITAATMKSMEVLWNQDWDIGGYGRYNYTSEADSSGPWPFTALYIARAYTDIGDYEKVWRVLDWLDTIPGASSGSWFEVYCDRVSPPYAQLGITPWTWAEMIMLFVNHVLGIRPEEDGIHFKPVMIPTLSNIKGDLRIGSRRMQLEIKTDSGIVTPSFECNLDFSKISDNEIVLPYSKDDIILETVIPVKG
ncbi:MAG: hypothetical protein GY863_10090 [bacterium]|nr:hypothetical protein [bacterium]